MLNVLQLTYKCAGNRGVQDALNTNATQSKSACSTACKYYINHHLLCEELVKIFGFFLLFLYY